MSDRTPQSTQAHPDVGAQLVLQASPNPVLGVDRDGRIVFANARAEKAFGWTARELSGKPVELIIPARFGDRHVAHRTAFFAHATARPMGIGLDLAGRRRDGTEFPVEISLAPVRTPDGLLVYATIVDITTRKALEDQLLQAQKMESVGRLAGGIAHDFNNMLFAIRGYVDMLLEDLDSAGSAIDVDAVRPSVTAIGTAVERATALTAQLLAFSRRQVVRPVTVDLRESVSELEPMVRRVIGEQIRLVLALDPGTGLVRADPGQLDQILINLAVNARDAMPQGGTITVETGNVVFDEAYAVEHFQVEPGAYVMLALSDTGHGMDRETRLHMFEPFFTTKDPGKGTGLGLATIYGVVRQAGGHIWLYSEPGHGTTFKLYFPRVGGVPEAPAVTTAPARAPADGDRAAGRGRAGGPGHLAPRAGAGRLHGHGDGGRPGGACPDRDGSPDRRPPDRRRDARPVGRRARATLSRPAPRGRDRAAVGLRRRDRGDRGAHRPRGPVREQAARDARPGEPGWRCGGREAVGPLTLRQGVTIQPRGGSRGPGSFARRGATNLHFSRPSGIGGTMSLEPAGWPGPSQHRLVRST